MKASSLFSMVPGILLSVALTPLVSGQPSSAAVINASEFDNLQEAFDAAPRSGALIVLPAGEFQITAPLILSKENVHLKGAGPGTHIINKNENGAPALRMGPTDYSTNSRARIWRVQISDLRISGNPKSGDGVLAEGVNEIFVHGVSIDHNGGHGLNLVDCYEDPRIADSLFTYNGLAGVNILRGHDIVVNGNQFEENQDGLRCIDSFNLCMNGNNLDDHLRHGIVVENTYGSVISGNMIEECQGTALILDRDCYGNTVSANVIAHNFGGGVDLRDAWGCAISANTFTIVATNAVVVRSNSGRIAIGANNFSNAHIGGTVKRDDAAAGVVLEATSDIAISGNVFSGMAGAAITAAKDARRIVVTGNVIADWGRKSETIEPIQLNGAAESVVANNVK